MPHASIQASAPGKLVLSGEYAVLAGAPALVAAVDRRVTCTLSPQSSGGWRFESRGFEQQLALSKGEVFAASTGLACIARQCVAESAAPEHLQVVVDSTSCYRGGTKLGVGSSAATVTAAATAFAALEDSSPRMADLYRLHAELHGGGSGLDVAAAVSGGIIRFERRRVLPVRLARLPLLFLFTGTSTPTGELVARFSKWRGDAMPPTLEMLVSAAHEVADCTVNAEMFLGALSEYADLLERLDSVARIGIFGPGHRRARVLAERCGVVYKPCGAGGGDMGMAVAEDADALADFAQAAAGDADLAVVPMEITPDGITVRSR